MPSTVQMSDMAVVHESHVRGGGRLAVGAGGDVGVDVLPAVAQGGQAVNPLPPFQCHGVRLGGAGWGLGHVGLAVAGAAHGGYALQLGVSNQVPPPVDGGHPDAVSSGGRAFAVGGGERGALVSGNVEEGVEEEFSDALAQGGRLDEVGHPNGLTAARGVEL